ncbi:Peptidase inhibitor I9 [Actinokineospora alba]|uniref:Peptidase inhibitor I9 n=1 Tax=Actinokineospora alba TaxID=504798 RepID=A0A1H0W2P3_9PSEU|nr:S8 family peptidase [Actinokineospora alba]TDP67810.1 peptidase inhibitor I9 [Actinokineospora alba]SDI72259.1 Peptidase inhibitor I9 [Actinokineospora alba]SDP84994.1 Peptidase inhibitor I9 [Actinokineospora alba]
MTLRREGRRGRLAIGFALIGSAATVVALASPAQAQEGEILLAGSPDAIEGSYIVMLKDGARSQSADVAHNYGGKVRATYESSVNGFSVTMSESQARKLAADDAVEFVQANQKIRALDVQPNPPSWGLDRIDQADLPLDKSFTYSGKADNVTAFVIDTGVQADHPALGGRVSGGFDAIDNDDKPDDEHGHGTHVAGTIGSEEYGVAKGVKIVPVRVLDAQGSGSTEGVVAGIDWVAKNHQGPSVANMSLGGAADEALDKAVQAAIESGVTFAVAAGNSSDDAGGSSPARVTEALTVAASDDADKQAEFSSFGKVVDLYAPGVDITSAWIGGETKTISGTSMATPHVAGAVALYLAANPDATPSAVAEAITAAATKDKIGGISPDTVNLLLKA